MRSRGFSLAEILLAIGVLTTLILLLIGLVASGLASSDKGEEHITAVHVAEAEMGRWKARTYSEILALSGQDLAPVPRLSDGREYQCQLVVQPVAPAALNPDGSVLRLTVRVNWQEATALGGQGTRSERPASLELESVVGPGASL